MPHDEIQTAPMSTATEQVDGEPQTSSPRRTLDDYAFPTKRLARRLEDSSKTPLVLVFFGSLNPITVMHLRVMEMARDYVRFNTDFEVIAGYISPVGDAYGKAGLLPAWQRVEMCELAAQDTSDWLMVDDFEALHKEYQPTAVVLDHFNHELNEAMGGIETHDGTKATIHISMVAGADLVQTFSTPGVWRMDDINHILGDYGTFVIERAGTDIDEAVSSLEKWKDNIWTVPQLVYNDVSSTKIRLHLKRDMSIAYLVPHPVIEYIKRHRLYKDQHERDNSRTKGKRRAGLHIASAN